METTFFNNIFNAFSNVINYSCPTRLKNLFGKKQEQGINDPHILSKIFQYNLGKDLKEAHRYTLVSKEIQKLGHEYYATVFNNTCFDDKTKFEHFRSLNLRYQNKIGPLMTHLDFSKDGIQLQNMIEMIRLCPNLESIKLSFAWGADVLNALMENCPNLKCLGLSEEWILGDQEIEMLGRAFPKLQSIYLKSDSDLEGLSEKSLLVLPQIPNLESLFLSDYYQISSAIATSLSKCSNLKSLTINFIREGISDQGMEALAQWEKLQSLSINRSHISQKGFEALARFRNLQSLSINVCHQREEAFLALTQCPHLKTLSISYWDNITDQTILALAKCSNLQSLSIDKCKNVTDQAISELARLNPNLRIVHNNTPFYPVENKPTNRNVSYMSSFCSNLLERISLFFRSFLQKKN